MSNPMIYASKQDSRWNFYGRTDRMVFWGFSFLFMAIVMAARYLDVTFFPTASLADFKVGMSSFKAPFHPFTILTFLLLLYPGTILSARRLHDRDKSAWLLLLNFIPLLGPSYLLFQYVRAGTPGNNRFGPNPSLPRLKESELSALQSAYEAEHVPAAKKPVRAPSNLPQGSYKTKHTNTGNRRSGGFGRRGTPR